MYGNSLVFLGEIPVIPGKLPTLIVVTPLGHLNHLIDLIRLYSQ